jgi:hypothetical protein
MRKSRAEVCFLCTEGCNFRRQGEGREVPFVMFLGGEVSTSPGNTLTSSSGGVEGESPRIQATRSASSLGAGRLSTSLDHEICVHLIPLHWLPLAVHDCSQSLSVRVPYSFGSRVPHPLNPSWHTQSSLTPSETSGIAQFQVTVAATRSRTSTVLSSRTLGSWIRIPLKARMSVCVYSVFVLSCV